MGMTVGKDGIHFPHPVMYFTARCKASAQGSGQCWTSRKGEDETNGEIEK